jgi:hypothetical protein
MHPDYLLERVKGRNNYVDLGVCGKLLTGTKMRCEDVVWIRLVQERSPMAGSCELDNEPSVSKKKVDTLTT